MPASLKDQSHLLQPYVPRLVIEWLRSSPKASFRDVEGTLAFVDISGFTKLTERLARRGKVGAEELNEILDGCFTELLSVAYADGAGLIKWGGDAVLLLFTGDGHAARASRSAFRMQRTIRSIGRLRTSSGLVTLRMSVGIHSGRFRFFLVGNRHRELVITGPAATRTVVMESAAGAGDVLLSPEAAAHLDARVLGKRKGEGVLLRSEPDVSSSPADTSPDTSGLNLSQCLPDGIRETLIAGAPDAEHRRITVAFIEFHGVDEMMESVGGEVTAEALDKCIRTAQEAAAQHEVTFFETDISKDGGKILLVAGAPRSAGNDEERMLRTVRQIVDGAGRLGVRAGVNAGRVFAGDFGPPYRRSYSIKGDAVNLAARLMARAEPGQILTTEAVLSRSSTAFRAEALEPFYVKGKARPVQAWSLGHIEGKKAVAGEATPFVGRE